jgi:prevent-host-death family protein
MSATISSRAFNQDTAGAKRAAREGPVFITDRGLPSYVLLTFEEYTRLAEEQPSITTLLSKPSGIENIEFKPPTIREPVRPATFD